MRQKIEQEGQSRLVKELTKRGWYCIKLHGNKYQSGLPDLMCINKYHGIIFIECKKPGGVLSDVQIAVFNKMSKHGAKIWILHDEHDLDCLYKNPNWQSFLKTGLLPIPKGFIKCSKK